MASTTTTTETASGVTYEVTTNSSLGVTSSYDVTITDPDGTTLYSGTIVPNVSGNVSTGTGFSLSIANALVGGTYVIPAGTTGSVDIAVSLATIDPTTIYIGGTATITTAVSTLSGLVLDVDGGTATLNSGLVASALSGTTVNITNGGTFSNGIALISVLSGTTINFGTGGGTFIANAGGTLLDLSSTTITGYDPSKDVIELEDTTATISGYLISGTGSSRTVTLYGTDGIEVASYSVTLATGVTLTDGTYNALSSDISQNPLQITYSGGNTYIGACFLPGSMIRTANGDVPVEDLRINDTVCAFDYLFGHEVERNVIWCGRRSVVVRPGYPDDESGYPVRVLKGAISETVPYKDMLITAEHCLFFEGKFIPARMLINGRSIFYDKSIINYTYYHIETEPHSVIWADGMLTETYLDTGNRAFFNSTKEVQPISTIMSKSWDDAPIKLDTERNFVEPIFRRIEERAAQLELSSEIIPNLLTDDPSLYVTIDNHTKLRMLREANGYKMFMLPADVNEIRIVSATSRPCDVIGPFIDDRRVLGVLVGEVKLFENDGALTISKHLTAEGLPGWYHIEHPELRWTNGNAVLPLERNNLSHPCVLAIQIKGGGPYIMAESCCSEWSSAA